MNRTYTIFRHEFLRTVRRTGFTILTLSLPVLALLGIGIYRVISAVPKPAVEVTTIGYVDELGGFDGFTDQGTTRLIPFDSVPQAKRALAEKEIRQYFVIPPQFMSDGRIDLYVARRELAPPEALAAALKSFVTSNLLRDKVSPETVARIERPFNLVTTTLTPTGEIAREQGGYANFIIPALFGFLLALALNFSSGYMMQGLAEEKEDRLIEILLSSVSPRQLLAGKLLGYGSAGLLQVAIWAISIPLLLMLAVSSFGGFLVSIRLSAGFWLLGVVYFILGYSLFAVFSASVAAISRTVREAQALVPVFTLFSVAPFWFLSLLMFFPNNPVWVVFSIFPLSGPVLTLLRMGITGVPAWQLAASMGVLVVCIVLGLLLAAKLLEIYLLMYGRRPSLSDIVRTLRSR